jgi:O-antigen ligase
MIARFKAALSSPLLPVWLVVGLLPFGRSAELGTLLCLIGTIMLFAREPRALADHPGARLLLGLLAAYVAAAVVSAVDAVRPGHSWITVAGLLRYAPLGIYVCFAVRRNSRVRPLLDAVAAVIVVWAVDAWIQMLTGWSLGGHAGATRISGIFGAGNLKLGPALAVLSPFVLWAARVRWARRGLLLAFLLLLGPILLAGERSAWLMYALVGLAFAWREAGSLPRFAGWSGAALLLAALAMGLAWKVSPRFEARMQRTLLVFSGSPQAVNTATSGRLDIWHVAWRMFQAHPFNGVGVRDFRYAYPAYAPADDHFVVAEPCGPGQGACHPHQIVLEVAADTGSIGLLLWLGGAIAAWRFWRQAGIEARRRAFPVSVALGVMVFPLNTHLAFYSAWWGLLFWWLLALWCAVLTVRPDADFAARSQ